MHNYFEIKYVRLLNNMITISCFGFANIINKNNGVFFLLLLLILKNNIYTYVYKVIFSIII